MELLKCIKINIDSGRLKFKKYPMENIEYLTIIFCL